MAVTPGSGKRLNVVTGYASSVGITEADKTKHASTVYPAGIILHDENGFLYHSDGIKTLQQLLGNPIVDKKVKILTAAERKMITDVNKANGFVATDASNKINDDRLKVVEDGKIVESYLSKYIENGMIKLEVIPQDVRAHMKFVAKYTDLDSMTDEQKKGMIFVIDASADPTVNSGWAIYVWDKDGGEESAGEWLKIQEGEGIDYDYDSITTHDSVEKVGAVMYDHTVFLKSPTLDQIAGLEDPVVSPTFSTFTTSFNQYANVEANLGATISEYGVSGTHKVTFTVASGGTVTIKGFDDGDASDGTPKTIEKTDIKQLNAALKNLKVVAGASGGTITMDLDDGYDTKEITVTTKPYEMNTKILNAETPVAVQNGQEIAFPVLLDDTGIDPVAQFNVTVTPTNCSMKDDASGPVADGSPWTLAAGSIAEVNAKLKAAKIVGAGKAATIAIAVTEGSLSATLTVNIAYADPTLEGSDTLTAADGTDAALGITLGTTNADPSANHTVVVTPTGLNLKDAESSPVADGTPLTIGPDTCDNINAKLAAVKVTGDSDGGTVEVKLDTDKATKTVTVTVG